MSAQKNADPKQEGNVGNIAHQNPSEDDNNNKTNESTTKDATPAQAEPSPKTPEFNEQETRVGGENDRQGPVPRTPSLSDDGNSEANVSPISEDGGAQADPAPQSPIPNEEEIKAIGESISRGVASDIEIRQDNGKRKAAESSTRGLNETHADPPPEIPMPHGQDERTKKKGGHQGTALQIYNHGEDGSATECPDSSVKRTQAKLPKPSARLPPKQQTLTEGESSAQGATRQGHLTDVNDDEEPSSQPISTNNNAVTAQKSSTPKSPKRDRQTTAKKQSRHSSLGLVYQSYHEYGNDKVDLSSARPARRSKAKDNPRGPAQRDKREPDEIELSSTRAVRGAPVNPPLISRIPDRPHRNKKGVTTHGPPYQSYQEYDDTKHGPSSQPQPTSNEVDTGPSFAEGNSWVHCKIGLHLLGILFSICTLGLSFSLIDNKDQRGEIVAISSPVPACALLWSIIEFAVRHTSKTKKMRSGIHPAGHIAGCLVILFASITSIVFEWIYIQDIFDFCEYSSGKRKSADPDYWEYKCEGKWGTQKVVLITMAAIATMIWLVYLMLFVIAFIDNSRRTQRK